MDKLVDHLFVFEGAGNFKVFYCSYSEYRNKMSSLKKQVKKEDLQNNSLQEQPKNKRTYAENIEYAKIESEINQLELEKTQLEQFLQDSELDYETILDKSNKLGKVIQLIDQKLSLIHI